MNTTIPLSTDGALALPTRIATIATANLGVRGSGKTTTAVVITEGLLRAGIQVVVIDPLDVWWGLRSSADGESEGLPITVLGGHHQDLPLDEDHAERLAVYLAANPVSVIISLRHMTGAGQRRFMTAFADAFYFEKGKAGNATPVLMVLDEASQFVPQKVMGETARMVGAIEKWVRQGRASGIGCMLIDQRPASVNKDVLTQCEIILAHRLTSPQDRAALREWISAHATGDEEGQFMDSLASLETGQAWVWSPHVLKLFQLVQVRQRSTFDSSSTPEIGAEATARPTLAQVAPDGLAQALTVAAESDAVPARTKGKKGKEAAPISFGEKEIAELIRKEVQAQLQPIIKQLGSLTVKLTEAPAVRQVSGAIKSPAKTAPAAPKPAAAPQAKPIQGLTKAQVAILDALVWWRAINVVQPSKAQVAFVAGYAPGGGHFRNSVGPLVTSGLIESHPDSYALTENGQKKAHSSPGLPTTLATYHDRIRGVIKNKPQLRILDAAIARGQRLISADILATTAGFAVTGGHFRNSLGPLVTLNLLERSPAGLKPTSLLFPKHLT